MAVKSLVKTLLSSVSTSGAGSSVKVGPVGPSADTGVVQAIISNTATVALEGSLDGSNWFEITSFSQDGGEAVTLPQWVRGNVTSYTSGNVTLLVQVPGEWVTL